jgi:shikimate kinase
MEPGQSLESLYAQRRPLYERFAEVTVECGDLTQDQAVRGLLARGVA